MVVEQTVVVTAVVERQVIVTPTPAAQYSSKQVGTIVESWPAKSATFGETRLWAAVFDFCLSDIPLKIRAQGSTPEPLAFVAVPDGPGKWVVSTSCEAKTIGGGNPVDRFQWIFFEDGPKLLPLDGFAGEVKLR